MKPLFDVNIDVYENGQGVIIKRIKDKKILGGRLFLKGQEKEMKEWMDKITKEETK